MPIDFARSKKKLEKKLRAHKSFLRIYWVLSLCYSGGWLLVSVTYGCRVVLFLFWRSFLTSSATCSTPCIPRMSQQRSSSADVGCPNPHCKLTFHTNRAASVHVSKSRICKRWRAKRTKSNGPRFVASSGSRRNDWPLAGIMRKLVKQDR